MQILGGGCAKGRILNSNCRQTFLWVPIPVGAYTHCLGGGGGGNREALHGTDILWAGAVTSNTSAQHLENSTETQWCYL